MELSAEKPLIEIHLEPLRGAGSSEDESSDSGEDASSEDALWRPDGLCQEAARLWQMSAAESEVRRSARRKLYLACAVCLVFMTGEVVGGYAAHSLSIVMDFCSIVISIFSMWLSMRPPTDTMTFGWFRGEILGMLLSMVSIWAVTAALVASAAQRIHDGDIDIDSRIMLVTSSCGVGVNVLMVLILHQSEDSHGPGHGHGRALPSKRRQGSGHHHSRGNATVKAAFIHVLGDLVQSVGVLLAATIIYFWPEYKVADPICTFLFSVLVLGTTLPITKEVLRVLMAGAPRGVDFNAVRERLLSVKGVTSLHSLHVWSLNTTRSFLSVHMATEEGADAQIVLKKATKLLRSKFGFSSVTIQVEH